MASEGPEPIDDGKPTRSVAEIVASVRDTLRRLGPAAPLAIAVTVVPPIGTLVLTLLATLTRLPFWMKDHPAQAVPLYVVSFWALGICCLPTYAYSVLGGWAFGFWPALIGTTLAYGGACCIAFALARRLGLERTKPLIDEHPRLVAVRRVMAESSRWRSIFIIALLRIVPVSPFAITNVALGAIGVDWTPFIVGSFVGVVPRTAAVVWFASGLSTLPLQNSWGLYVFAGASVVLLLALVIATRFARTELNRQLAPSRVGVDGASTSA